MGYLIDSDVLIAAERGLFSLSDFADQLSDIPLAIAAITASELLQGVHRAQDAARRKQRSEFVEGLFEVFPVVPFDLEVARIHAEMWAEMQKQGRMAGANDLMIAATARMLNYGVVTLNEKDFAHIPGLEVVNPL